jgi:hypothetical protein
MSLEQIMEVPLKTIPNQKHSQKYCVTIGGVWIVNWIQWPLAERDYK